jgi:CcmD family protein
VSFRRRSIAWIVAAVVFVGCAPLPDAPPGAAAQSQPQPVDEFVPVSPDELNQEQLPAAPLVFIAYAVAWLILIGYIFVLWRRIGRVERELGEVRARMASPR